MEVAQDAVSLLPAGDYDKLGSHEKEAFNSMQERIAQQFIQSANQFQSQFPGLRIDFRFQMDVYLAKKPKPSTVRYSSRVY